VWKTKGMNMLRQVKKSLRALHDDTSGAMSVEKILILALIAVPILIVLLLFRGTIVDWFKGQSGQLQP
jgi:Flp pilus assembly pilin Flp